MCRPCTSLWKCPGWMLNLLLQFVKFSFFILVKSPTCNLVHSTNGHAGDYHFNSISATQQQLHRFQISSRDYGRGQTVQKCLPLFCRFLPIRGPPVFHSVISETIKEVYRNVEKEKRKFLLEQWTWFWIDCALYLEYICVDAMGNLLMPDYVSNSFKLILRDFGLRPIRFHDLRHSCASLLLANGVPMKQIQEWLGHSDFSTTANIYSHLDYSSKISSAEAMMNGLGMNQHSGNEENSLQNQPALFWTVGKSGTRWKSRIRSCTKKRHSAPKKNAVP